MHTTIPSATPSAHAEGSEPGLTHCTDWLVAKMRDSSTDQDRPISLFTAAVIHRDLVTGTLSNLRLPMIPPQTPIDPGWRVLLRPGQPFAVFYTETPTSPHAVKDTPTPGLGISTTSAGNIDRDGDGVPDYAELIASCLVTAHARYKVYYGLDEEVDTPNMNWLALNYTDPASGQAFEDVYPTIIQSEKEAQTFPIADFLRGTLLFVPSLLAATGATYITIDRDVTSSFRRDSPPWEYPGSRTLFITKCSMPSRQCIRRW